MTRKRSIQITLAAAAIAFVLLGLSRISFNVDVLKLLPPNLKEVQGLSLYLKHFARPAELVITLESPDPDAADALVESLAGFLKSRPDLFQQVVHRPPWEDHAAETAELIAWLWINQPPAAVDSLLAGLTPARAAATLSNSVEELSVSLSAQTVATLSYDPFRLSDVALRGLPAAAEQSEFSSADGAFRVLYAEMAPRQDNYRGLISRVLTIRDLIQNWKEDQSEPVSIGITGEPAFVAEISGGMEWDMRSSVGATLFIIAIIFWGFYRSVKPLLCLIGLLLLVFVCSLAISGFVLRELTVISVGFASILLGLSVDYGVIVFQQLAANPDIRGLRRVRASVWWAAITTAAAFFCLNVSGLPGLAQLGTLVGIGVLAGALVMLHIFPWCAVRLLPKRAPAQPAPPPSGGWLASPKFNSTAACLAALFLAIAISGLLWSGFPDLESSSRPLRPRQSLAYDTLDQIYAKLGDTQGLLTVLVEGNTSEQVAERLQEVQTRLAKLKSENLIEDGLLPLPFWPSPRHQQINLPRFQTAAAQEQFLKEQLLAAGFTADSSFLLQGVLQHWRQWASAPRASVVWPENAVSQWILRRNVFHDGANYLAAGLIRPHPDRNPRDPQVRNALRGLAIPGVYVAGWDQLGLAITDLISHDLPAVLFVLITVLIVMLALVFRRAADVALIFLLLTLSLCSLLGAMAWLGIRWNLFNLAAILLLLGTGVDYAIHILLDLRRSASDADHPRSLTRRAILVCGLTTVAGFGSLVTVSNIGLASLGQVCALGMLFNTLISVFLLPQLPRLGFASGANPSSPPQCASKTP